MRGMAVRRILAVIAACAAVLTCGFPALGADEGSVGFSAVMGLSHAGPDTSQTGYGTFGDLAALVAANEGGTATLTQDIIVDWWEELYVEEPTVLDMGEYNIRVLTYACLWVDGPITFMGLGAPNPMFFIESGASIVLARGAGIEASASGAVAVDVEEYGSLAGNQDGSFPLVRAAGEDAIAVLGHGGLDLWDMRVEAPGSGGVAAWSDGDVFACRCAIIGEAEAVWSGSGNVTLDLATAQPFPEGAKVIQRKAIIYDGYEMAKYGIHVPIGEEIQWRESLEYWLYNVDDLVDRMGIRFPVQWEPFDGDLSQPGMFSLACTPDAPFERDLVVGGLERVEIPLYVYDPAVPHLEYATTFATSVLLATSQDFSEQSGVRLWYSEDGGTTWTDLIEQDSVISVPYIFGTSQLDLTEDKAHWFRLEVTEGPVTGMSNILEFRFDPLFKEETGGDRDEGDRGEQEPLPDDGTVYPGTWYGSDNDGDNGRTYIPDSDTPKASPVTKAVTGAVSDLRKESGSPESPPSNPDMAASEPTPPSSEPQTPERQSTYAGKGVVYTPAQLRDLMEANPVRITFIGSGMRLSVPTEGLRERLPEGASLAVELDRTADGFAVRLYAGDIPLEDFPEGTQIWIPVKVDADKWAEVSCKIEDEPEIPASAFENGSVLFVLEKPGQYALYIPEEDKPVAPERPAAGVTIPPPADISAQSGSGLGIPLLIAGGGAATIAASLILFLRRRISR